jgi:hypothetical protein
MTMNDQRTGEGRRALLAGALSTAALLVAAVPAAPQEPAAEGTQERLQGTRSALDEWVKTERLISQEQRDWALGREILEDRIGVVQREVESLRKRIAEAEESIANADKKKTELVAEKTALLEGTAALGAIAAGLEAHTRALLRRLPDPIREQVKPLSQLLPEDSGATKATLGERLRNVVGILNEINKFNTAITVTSEVHTLEGGATAEVTALYVGIGQGFYVNGKADAAGVGTATADGWVWTPANDAAPAIAKAIAVFKTEEPAAFTRLPVRIASAPQPAPRQGSEAR